MKPTYSYYVISLVLILFSTRAVKAQWNTGTDINNTNSGTVTIGATTSSNAKFNVLGDAFINNRFYYREQYYVETATYLPINVTKGSNTLTAGVVYRIEMVTIATASKTGSVYIVKQTSASAWEAKLVSIGSAGSANTPRLRINGSQVEIYHNHASGYYINVFVTATISNNATTISNAFFGLEGAITTVNDSVGIGTSAPLSTLHTNGILTVGSGTSIGSIGSTQLTGLGGTLVSGRLTFGTDGTGWGFRIAKNQGGTVTDYMTVKDDGTVGIGTTTPTKLLDVNGDARIGNTTSRRYLKISSNEYPEIRFQTPSDDEQIRLGVAAGSYPVYNLNGGDFYVYSNYVNRMDLIVRKQGGIIMASNGGMVGVGTATPAAKLDLQTAQTSYGTILTNVKDDAEGLLVRTSDNDAGLNILKLQSSSSAVSTSYVDRFVVTKSGNVGIGTASPQATLAVNGDIYAKKIKVTQSGWSDYVFEDGYLLKPLSEVDLFVKKHKHLPDVPSAREIEKNDLDLGEMNKILLQKIEELTLYLIQNQKQVEELKQNNERLTSRILLLESTSK